MPRPQGTAQNIREDRSSRSKDMLSDRQTDRQTDKPNTILRFPAGAGWTMTNALILRSPREYMSSYSYGCRITSDHTILVVHRITV